MANDYLNWELLTKLECPICYNYMNSNIYMCINGHNCCGTCFAQLERCASCKTKFLKKTRNYLLEDIAGTLKYPCQNKQFGCQQMSLVNDIEKHADICCYRLYNCVIDDCKWTGRNFEIEKHFLLKHKNLVLYGSENMFSYDLNSDDSFIKELIVIDGKKFILHISGVQTELYFIVQYLGNPDDIKGFYYEVEMHSDQDYNRKILVSEQVFNDLYTTEDDIIELGMGVTVPKSILDSYTNENNVLAFKVLIKSN